MNTLFVILRAIHYASAMMLFGEILFTLLVAWPVFGHSRAGGTSEALDRRFWNVVRYCFVATVGSGVGWFVAESTVMAGLPIGETMAPETLSVIFGQTTFGLVFAIRAVLIAMLAAVLVVMSRADDGLRRLHLALVAATLAAAYLGSLAGAGHAVAGNESEDFSRIGADVAHLLAAGAWLGALPALVFVLGGHREHCGAAQVAQRFSALGLASVGALIASGVANTTYQVGSIPALVGTDYGRLLLAKLALFAVMLGIAAVNRGMARQAAAGEEVAALRMLRRNARLEIAFGIGVVFIVGALGIVIPATHQPVIWPFDRTLSFGPVEDSAWMQLAVAVLGAVGCISAITLLAGALGRPPRIRLAAMAGVVIPAAVLVSALAVPACPTIYQVSPVPYAAEAVATGAALFAANCSSCHGHDDSNLGGKEVSPADPHLNLNERVAERREGELFWSIAEGTPGTLMPGFAGQMSEVEIWSLVQFLDAQAAAQNARALSDGLKPSRPVPAPDFTYEIAGRPQETLRQLRGSRVVLLVFYTMPTSLPRLRELAALESDYTVAGAAIIATGMPASPVPTSPELGGSGESLLAFVNPAVASTYLMFAQRGGDAVGGVPAHIEYLVDRFGYIRVRRIGVPEATASGSGEVLRQIELLAREPPREESQWGHRH